MVDIDKGFRKSYSQIKKKKFVVIPMILSLIVSFLLIGIFLFSSGAYPMVKEIAMREAEFTEQKEEYIFDTDNLGDENYTIELLSYISRNSQNSQYDEEFNHYLNETGFSFKEYSYLISAKNVVIGLLLFVLGTILAIYLTTMSLSAVSIVVRDKKLNKKSVIKETNSFAFRQFMIMLLSAIILITPLLAAILISILFGLISNALMVIMIILSVILWLAYLIYMSLKLYFAAPMMYLKNISAVDALKGSYKITKGRLWDVFLIAIVVTVMSWISGGLLKGPMDESLWNILYSGGLVWIVLYALLAIGFMVLYATSLTFINLFLFDMYKLFSKKK